MPTRPAQACPCGGVRRDDVCDKCGKGYGRKRASAAKRGYTTKWQRTSKAFLAKHKTCVACGRDATVVDHIVPHRGDKGLFWERENWQAMCEHCHNAKTGAGQ